MKKKRTSGTNGGKKLVDCYRYLIYVYIGYKVVKLKIHDIQVILRFNVFKYFAHKK